jgi:acetyltransferase-like isoleucine patch superfamily enzyme
MKKGEATTDPNSPNFSGERSTARRLVGLLGELRAMLAQQASTVQQRWNRSLPFADYIVDRWEKARTLGFGDGSSIYDSALVLGDVKVGTNTWIGPFTVLDGSGGLSIGSNCSISAGVQIYSHDSVQWALSGGTAPYEYLPTLICDRCYIGPNVVIAKGVRIGPGCIIGANSLVLGDIPENSTAVGTPCRVIGTASFPLNPLPHEPGTPS